LELSSRRAVFRYRLFLTTIASIRAIGAVAARRAQSLDENGNPPRVEVEAFPKAGLLSPPFSSALGGVGLASGRVAARTLAPALRILGRASLPLGRLYEGNVNAVRLVETYGSVAQGSRMADEARRGALIGVWAANERTPLAPVFGQSAPSGHFTFQSCSRGGFWRSTRLATATAPPFRFARQAQ
jgi:alkylation response protein AidB-like acyl-CoA dehydrogenase